MFNMQCKYEQFNFINNIALNIKNLNSII